MPGLTVTEKEHWKDRIGKRIDKRIEGIYAEDPNLKERIEREARARALASLNLTDLDAEMNHIEGEENRNLPAGPPAGGPVGRLFLSGWRHDAVVRVFPMSSRTGILAASNVAQLV